MQVQMCNDASCVVYNEEWLLCLIMVQDVKCLRINVIFNRKLEKHFEKLLKVLSLFSRNWRLLLQWK